MPAVELTAEQVVDLVRQLPPKDRRKALMALANDATEGRERRMQHAEKQLRQLSSERGLDWDQMSEEQREAFIDDLVHEDR